MGMKITQKDFRAFKVRFHRNGVMGESFYLCRFRFVPTNELLQAVVFEGNGRVAVTSDNMCARWRGDDFERALRAAIKAVEAAQPEMLHAE